MVEQAQIVMKTSERSAYEYLKIYHNDDQGLVEGWRRADDPRWTQTVKAFAEYTREIDRLRAIFKDLSIAADTAELLLQSVKNSIREKVAESINVIQQREGIK